MPWGIYIPTDQEAPMEFRLFGQLRDYQEAVEGLIEPIDLILPTEATMYVDEEGRLKRASYNARATFIVMAHNPAYLFAGANILGPVVIIGPPDEDGEAQDVPAEFVDLLLKTAEYKVEVQTVDDAEAWNGNARRFTDLLAAYEHGINLAHRWFAVERVRIVPA
jgi:hypothetical protein